MSEMLETLFGSKARARVLRFFLLNPEKEMTSAELSQKIMVPAANVRRELLDLKKIKFVNEKTRQGKKIYSLNQNFHFYPELKGLISKATISPQCKSLSKIKTIGEVKLALLSGIFINHNKGKADMVLVVNNLNRSKLRNFMNNLEAEVGKEVSFILMNSEEFKYRLDMLDRFLLDFLEGPHTELVDKIPGLKRFILGRKKY